jgi:hypothetical protein
MAVRTVSVNRAPVLTLWAAVVAQRLGFDKDEALTLGRSVAGLNAQSKGRKLGIFEPPDEEAKRARQQEQGQRFLVEVCGRAVPARNTPAGVRALQKDREMDPDSVRRYLEGKFGEALGAVRSAMTKIARAYSRSELAKRAYPLYERFRPDVPEGKRGWGARGDLDLDLIERLAKRKAPRSGDAAHRA